MTATDPAPSVHQLTFLIDARYRDLGMTCRCLRCHWYFRDAVEMEATPCQ